MIAFATVVDDTIVGLPLGLSLGQSLQWVKIDAIHKFVHIRIPPAFVHTCIGFKREGSLLGIQLYTLKPNYVVRY